MSGKGARALGARLALLVTGALLVPLGISLSAVRFGPPNLEAEDSVDQPLIVIVPPAVSPGQSVAVEGIRFTAGRVFQVSVAFGDGAMAPVGQFQADERGRIESIVVQLPTSLLAGSFQVMAQRVDGPEMASTSGYVLARIPTVSLSNGVGNAGDSVAFSATGFAPGESLSAYLNNLGGRPFASFAADELGNLGEATAAMPYGPTGENTIILVGGQSKSVATASFIVVGFFPTVTLSNYAPRGDEVVGFSGSAFGPDERVRVYFNSVASPPVKTVTTDGSGSFEEPNGYDVPFGLKGKQTLVFSGESSGAVVAANFEVSPYTPSIEPSTWSGRPGTSITFYGSGFARSELVRVYRAATRMRRAEEVSCFRTNENGEVGGLGYYTIQLNDEVGPLNIELSTEKSQVSIQLSVQALPAIGDLPSDAVRPNRGCDVVEGGR